jgi:cell division protein FtsA
MEPLASAEAVLTPEEKQDGVLLADMGGGTTDLALFKDNTIFHTSVLPVAGYQVTRDISVGLGISFELAEEMKKKYGDVTPQDETSIPKDMPDITGDGHSISYQDLSDIIRVRIEEMLRLIVLELPQQDYRKLIPAGLVITGGGANLPGIADLGEKTLRMPVRLGRPISLPGVSDALDDPAYATGVGLLLWKLKNQGTAASAPAAKDSGMRRLLTRMFKLFR